MEHLILLNQKTGGTLRWVPPSNFSFVEDLPLLPVHATEAGRIASALPVAFVQDESTSSGWNLVAVCGREPQVNSLTAENGQWRGGVVPECIRYLPFATKDLGGGKALAGIDRRYARRVLADGDAGVALYSDDGQLHEHAGKRVAALRAAHPKMRRTQEILAMLLEADLLAPWPQSAVKNAAITIDGLHTIDEKKLSQLSNESFLELRGVGALALCYSALLSLYQIRKLVEHGENSSANDGAVQTVGDLDLEFLNDSGTIKFGPTI